MKKSYLQVVLDALRRAEELEIYLLIGVAGVTILLQLFHVIPESLLSAVTLGVLVLLATTMLRLRSHLSDLLHQFSRTSQSLFHDGPAHDIKTTLRTGRNILLSGTSLTRTLRNHLSDLEHLVSSGGSLKVLVLDPNSPLADAAAMRSSQQGYRVHQPQFINASLRDLESLMSLPEGSVEIRLSQYPFSFGAILVDNDTPNASIHLRYYSYRPKKGEGPYFNLYPSDQLWYEHFRSELEAIWADSQVYVPGQSS